MIYVDAEGRQRHVKRVGDKLDMGGTAVYLASRAGDYTIGETLTVDGGIVNALLPTHFADPG